MSKPEPLPDDDEWDKRNDIPRPSDPEWHTEWLLEAVNDPSPNALACLSRRDIHRVLAVRLGYAHLMLAIALKLEAPVKPPEAHDDN